MYPNGKSIKLTFCTKNICRGEACSANISVKQRKIRDDVIGYEYEFKDEKSAKKFDDENDKWIKTTNIINKSKT
jgi:hypothetical protein